MFVSRSGFAFGSAGALPPVGAACAREHDGKAGHEETRPCARPAFRIQLAGRAQLEHTILVRAVETRGEMAVSRRVRRCLLEHAQARANGPCQRLQRLEVAAFAPAQARKRLLADTGPGRPLGVVQSEQARPVREVAQRPAQSFSRL